MLALCKKACSGRTNNDIQKGRVKNVRASQTKTGQTINKRKTLVNTKGVYGSKFGNETHFLSFLAIVGTRNGTEGSNFHVRNAYDYQN